jgi:hypothetical protein
MWPTARETAARLGVSPGRVRQLIVEGRLKTLRVGVQHVVDPDSLAEYEQLLGNLSRDTMGRIIDGRRRRWQPA